ncbi:peptidase U35 [Hylemonella gracilis str. Niagara R]|uniref:Peptidase U35 n=1 Tax=Hylemonella gracilis str. Niagara R TaxID=1458275 RepID=A0A016XII0_9BURK|nr:prohead protease/major capsid protein fusion protein [Hylemonella gracilis]EYC51705.1 peptidase U35 [Hylemonella gracilis str. Niagara R]
MPQILEQRRAEMPLASISMAVRNVVARAEAAAAEAAEGAVTDAAARFELVFTTGAPVRRYDWLNDRYYLEELVVSPEAINLARLERGAPLLNTHWAWSLEDQIGVCDQPAIEGGAGTVQAQLSRRDSVRGIVQDLEDRVIRNVSVGYSRDAIEMVAPGEENGMWVYRVTRWTPMEVSLVPIPADMDSQVRSESVEGRQRLLDREGHELRTYPCAVTEIQTRIPTAGSAEHRNFEGSNMPQTATPQSGSGNHAPADQTRATPVQTATAAPASDATEAARQAGMQAERQRQADIRAAVQAARSTLGASDAEALSVRLIDAGVSVDAARREVLEQLAQRSAATATRSPADIRTERDEVETARHRMADALLLRARPDRAAGADVGGRAIDAEGARNFRGMDLMDMARHAIRAAGGNPDGLSRREIAQAALNLDSDARRAAGMHGSSDFPNVLANTVNRSLRAAYQLAPRTFTGWARRSSNKDFREKAVAQLSELSRMQKVNEGGEYKFLSFGDSAEKYSLSKYGGIIAITWESLINDDLAAFDRLPLMIAAEAAALESDIVYGILTGNATMSDTKALFHVDHGNLAGAGAAITDVTLGAARAAMRKQTGAKGRVLNLTPDFLIVGPDKEGEANKYTSAQFVAAKSADVNPAYNTSLEVVVEARLTGNQWYMAATPALIDTVEYSYLEGEEGLFTERKDGFEVDGLLIKARHVVAAKAIDWRGLYKNAGA